MDVTTLVIEAQEARARMQEAKKRLKAEVRIKYEAAMNRDIAAGSAEMEMTFAQTLARVHAQGVSQTILRREVLRTNVWGEWTKWRDLAEIEPERVTAANAKQARKLANLPYRWDAEARTITWLKGPKGEPLREEVIFGDLDPDERSGYQAVVRSHNNGKVIVDAYGTSLSKFLDLHVVPVMREVL